MFPVGVIQSQLRKGKYAKHVTNIAPVYMAAVLEYLITEVVDVAGIAAHKKNKKKIKMRHMEKAIYNDIELCKFLIDIIYK